MNTPIIDVFKNDELPTGLRLHYRQSWSSWTLKTKNMTTKAHGSPFESLDLSTPLAPRASYSSPISFGQAYENLNCCGQ
jgi:hypothetical protein